MPLLKTEPPAPVTSLDELLAIAAALEQEAASRYTEIAGKMRQEGNPKLAEVFEHLAAEEKGHLDSVVDWSRKAKGRVPDPTQIRWRLPETFDDEETATIDPRLLNAYRALAMAVRNEERAFAFWSYVAAHAPALEIRQAAEALAREELGHVSTLRRERRKAFHAEHQKIIPGQGSTGKDLADLERHLVELLQARTASASPEEHRQLGNLIGEANRNAEELEHLPIFVSGAPLQRSLSDNPTVLAEFLTEQYLAAGDATDNEDALQHIQELAGRSIARLAWLRADLPGFGR